MRNTPLMCAGVLLAMSIVSARTWVVDQKHPQASDSNNGTATQPLKTIQAAADAAQPGDVVLVHEGIYRERVAPARGGSSGMPITYEGAPGELVSIRASEVWTPAWRDDGGGVQSGALDNALFGSYNPFQIGLACAFAMNLGNNPRLTLGQVFVDGVRYEEMIGRSECNSTASSWFHDPGQNRIYVHFAPGVSPRNATVEISVRQRCFAPHTRGLGFIVVRNFTIEHAANQFPDLFWERADQAQCGALGTRAGHDWLIEHNTIRDNKNVGCDIGYESGAGDIEGSGQPTPSYVGNHVVRQNVISDNGSCGIAGANAKRTQIVNNLFERNNYLKTWAAEDGAIKTHWFENGLIADNVFIDNYTKAVWLDNVWTNTRVTRNVMINCRPWAIMVEMGFGPVLIDNNLIVGSTRGAYPSDAPGVGVYAHDASGVTLAHNVVIGCGSYGVLTRVATDRTVDGRLVENSHWRIYNNIILNNANTAIQIEASAGRTSDNVLEKNVTSSGTTVQSIAFDRAAMKLSMNVSAPFFTMGCGAVGGVDVDFFMTPMPASNPLAGFRQQVASGANAFDIAGKGPSGDSPVHAAIAADVVSGAMPLAVTFNGSSSRGSSLRYAWDFGNGQRATTAVAATVYATAGTYRATLVVTDSAGASDTASVTITVYDPAATVVIQAENFSGMSGIQVKGDSCIGYVDGGDWTRYDNVNFGPSKTLLIARVSVLPDFAGQTVEFRLDSLTGPLVATIHPQQTGAAWGTFAEQSAAASGVSGVHTLYVKYIATRSDGMGVGDFDWFSFSGGTPARAPVAQAVRCCARSAVETFLLTGQKCATEVPMARASGVTVVRGTGPGDRRGYRVSVR